MNIAEEQLKENQEVEEMTLKRQREILNIAELTMQDKDSYEKQWRKLLMVHLFLRKLLKRKIEAEMDKFRLVEKAYQEIKTTTGVSDATEIMNRFLSKEKTYGNLLSSIAQAEKRI
jgi:hypothetical protein